VIDDPAIDLAMIFLRSTASGFVSCSSINAALQKSSISVRAREEQLPSLAQLADARTRTSPAQTLRRDCAGNLEHQMPIRAKRLMDPWASASAGRVEMLQHMDEQHEIEPRPARSSRFGAYIDRDAEQRPRLLHRLGRESRRLPRQPASASECICFAMGAAHLIAKPWRRRSPSHGEAGGRVQPARPRRALSSSVCPLIRVSFSPLFLITCLTSFLLAPAALLNMAASPA